MGKGSRKKVLFFKVTRPLKMEGGRGKGRATKKNKLLFFKLSLFSTKKRKVPMATKLERPQKITFFAAALIEGCVK